MKLRSTFLRSAAVIALALVAASCSEGGTPDAAGPPTTVEQPRKGGTLTLGAAQEPSCADWYAPCGNSSWGRDMMASQTLPRAFDFVDRRYQPSALLAGHPTLDPGPPQVVTYRINPQAVWSDGQRITSADFAYTAEQAKSAGTSTAALAVDSVETPDPLTAVVKFKEPLPAWRDNFNRLLPSHLLAGKDRSAEMRDGYRFSGGPWVIDHWTKNAEIKLVPNPMYWGPKPNLDSVVFRVITDASAYQLAYKTNQLDMAFFQGAQPDVAELKALPGTHFQSSLGLSYEFVLFNTGRAPLDSVAVRQALAFASDRDAIVLQQSGAIEPSIRPAQAFMSPGNVEWYSEPFKQYQRDLRKVGERMTADGWVKTGDWDGDRCTRNCGWAKGDARAAIELNVASGNRRREETAQILQSQWKDAGFQVTINSTTSAILTGQWLPMGTFHAAILSLTPTATDPNLCATFCSKSAPSEANRFQGANYSRTSSQTLDDVWEKVSRELDDAKRLDLVKQGHAALATHVPALPISPILDIVVFNEEKVGGVRPTPVGAFYHLSEWWCRTC